MSEAAWYSNAQDSKEQLVLWDTIPLLFSENHELEVFCLVEEPSMLRSSRRESGLSVPSGTPVDPRETPTTCNPALCASSTRPRGVLMSRLLLLLPLRLELLLPMPPFTRGVIPRAPMLAAVEASERVSQ